MKLYIKQRVFSIGDKFDIYDENENVRFRVESAIFSFGHQRTVFDAYGNEVGFVKQKVFNLMPTFEIYTNEGLMGTISKKFTLFSNNYNIDYKNWDIEGDIMGWNYYVEEGSSSVACVNKKVLSLGDSYEIDIRDDSDILDVIMLVIAIDAANEDKGSGISIKFSN